MSHIAPILPENAPFGAAQRAWLNGWIAGHLTVEMEPGAASAAAIAEPAEDFPWHDPSLPLAERLQLAQGRKRERVLMAAMAQLDCGQCGYLCRSYAEALASGAETSHTRCVPGGNTTARALRELLELNGGKVAARVGAAEPATAAASDAAVPARFGAAHKLNGEGSNKDTRHVVLEIETGAVRYDVGDSLGVHAANCPELVAAIIERLGARAGDEVDCPDGSRRSLREALGRVCDIGRPADAAIEVLASRAPDLDESQRLQALAEGYPGAQPEDGDLLDLLLAFPSARPPVQELVSALGVLRPRLYSIASSPSSVSGEVHLTVAAVRYRRHGRLRKGVASTFLAERVASGSPVRIFVQPSHGFRLPTRDDAPVIMIGPGTGIAPFRAFLQERRARGAGGRNWLFFGDQHRASDFLYADELAGYERDGLLTRLDTAFSRDQADRIYVQHRMRERSAELWAWLQQGAHLYVCGAAPMARDVDAALGAIIARQGRMAVGEAKRYLAELARNHRYLRDVY